MLNIDELKARSGMSSLSSESWSGGVTGEFRNTYNKIMKSDYSANTHLLAAESLINEVIVDEFTDSLMVANLAQESKILSIINPLANSASSEANNIYYRICEILGTEGKENIADKASAVGTKIWNTIKEAFRKLRLAFTNIIAGIRKALSGSMIGDFSEEYRKFDEAKIKVRNDDRLGNRTIKAMSANKDNIVDGDIYWGSMPQALKKFNDVVTSMKEDTKKIISGGQINKIDAGFKEKYERLLGQAIAVINKKAENRWRTEKGSLAKVIIYGRDGKAHNMKYKAFMKDGYKWFLDPNFKNNLDSGLKPIDNVVKELGDVISEVEKYVSQYRDSEGKYDAEMRRVALKQLQSMRQVVAKMAPLSKDLFVEYIRIRIKVGTVVRNVLKGIGTTIREQNRTDRQLRKAGKEAGKAKSTTK